MLAVAWLALYLSSYGVLVRGEVLSIEQLKRKAETQRNIGDMFAADFATSSPVRRCTYFTGTGSHVVYHEPAGQFRPRLQSFGR